jgi:hypothetical protein
MNNKKLSLKEIVSILGLKWEDEKSKRYQFGLPLRTGNKKIWRESYLAMLRNSMMSCDIQSLEDSVDGINRDFKNSGKEIYVKGNVMSCIIHTIEATALTDWEIFFYTQKIKSPFFFNILLACIIEKLVEQNKIHRVMGYAKFYRPDGLTELRQMHLFRVRYHAGFKFDWFLRQCVYLECISKGVATDEDFQMLFNRRFAKPNIPLRELPKPLTVESIVEKMKEVTELSVNELEEQSIRESCSIKEKKKKYKESFEDILFERRRQLNNTFVFTPENIEKLLMLNQKLMDCCEKLREEGLKALRELEMRIANNNSFLQEYKVKAKIIPLIRDEDADDLCEPNTGVFSLLYKKLNSTALTINIPPVDDEKDIYFDKSLNWNNFIGAHNGEFAEYYICYAMYELYARTFYSLPDILQINELRMKIETRQQNFE